MPTVRYTLSVRSDKCGFLPIPVSIKCRHFVNVIRQSEQSQAPVILRACLPTWARVQLEGELPIYITGSSNGTNVNFEKVSQSSLVCQLVDLFKLNIDALGVEAVSDINSRYGKTEFYLTTTPLLSPPHPSTVSPTLKLARVELDIVCGKSSGGVTGDLSGMDLFSSQFPSHCEDAWADLVQKVITVNFTKRYPHVFGQWKQSFELERKHFSSIAQSFANMIAASLNEQYVSTMKQLFVTLKQQEEHWVARDWERLRTVGTLSGKEIVLECTDAKHQIGEDVDFDTEFGDMLAATLTRLYCLRIHPKLTKIYRGPISSSEAVLSDAAKKDRTDFAMDLLTGSMWDDLDASDSGEGKDEGISDESYGDDMLLENPETDFSSANAEVTSFDIPRQQSQAPPEEYLLLSSDRPQIESAQRSSREAEDMSRGFED